MANRGVNKVTIVGHLGQDPEVRKMPNGNSVANISVATSESWKDQNGQVQERTEWHRITFYRGLADVVGQYLTKGSQIYVQGKLQTRKWADQNGNDRYTTEIIADEMQMLGGGQNNANQGGQARNQGGQYGGVQNNQYNGPQNNQGAQNQGGKAPNNPPKMQEPDYSFDDSIPF